MNSQYVLFLTGVLVACFFVQGGNSLYCYNCNSLDHSGCTEFDVPRDMEADECHDISSPNRRYPAMCRKTVHYRFPGGGKIPEYHSTWRSCVNVQAGTKKHTQREYNPESMNITSYCSKNFCNRDDFS